MDKLSYDELNDMVAWARGQVVPGSRWRHYKGGEYIVTDIVIVEASNEVAVLYASVDHPTVSWVRPLNVWLNTLEWNGRTVPHFVQL